MEEDELESLDEVSIRDLEQWRLLVAVCPIFAHDHPWTTLDANEHHAKIVQKQADLFKAHIIEIPVHVPTDYVLVGDLYRDFERETNALLSSLECLVDGAKLPASGAQGIADAGEMSISAGLRRRCPKLLSLSALVQADGEPTAFEGYGQYLHLSQDVKSFKCTQSEVKRFHSAVGKLLDDAGVTAPTRAPAQASPPAPAQHKSRFNPVFWSSSTHLFESLVTNFKSCDQLQSKRMGQESRHHAMLQLNPAQDGQDGGEVRPEVCMVLASCADRKTWHETYCTILPASTNPPVHAPTSPVTNVCHAAAEAYQQERVFKIRHCEGKFTDVSDLWFGDSPAYPNAKPTKSLSDLLAAEILKDPYRFWPCDKKILAYTLANALLHLYEGPWIQTLWTPDKLFFMYEPRTETVFNIHQPWISCIVAEPAPEVEPLDTGHQFPLILSFAKLLLELERGEEVKAVTTGRSKTPSLLRALWEYCHEWSKRQLDDDYAEALDACVNFPKWLLKRREEYPQAPPRDPQAVVRDVILARIVHPLERRLNLSQKAEWGRRNLALKARLLTTEPNSMAEATPPETRPYSAPEAPVSSRPSPFAGQPGAPRPRPAFSSTARPAGDRPKATRGGIARAHDPPPRARPAALARHWPNRRYGPATSTSKGTTFVEARTPTPSALLTGGGSESGSAASSNRGPCCSSLRPAPGVSSAQGTMRPGSRPVTPQPTRCTIPRTAKSATPPMSDKGASIPTKSHSASDVGAPIAAETAIAFRHSARSSSPNSRALRSGFGMCLCRDPKGSDDVSTTSFKYIHMTVDTRMNRHQDDERIRIAVLDTGLDRDHADFQRPRTKHFLGELGNLPNPEQNEDTQNARIVGYRDFCRPDARDADVNDEQCQSSGAADDEGEGDDVDDDDVPDHDGHGTQVAGILLRLAPHTELLVGRVCLGENSVGVSEDYAAFRKPWPDVVARAVRWAIRKGAHVINLSLGFRNFPWQKLAKLQSALEAARDSGVVVFAATSNDGSHEDVAWPANDAGLAIGVHSCVDEGSTKSKFTASPSRNGANFMVVGEQILSQRLTSSGGGFCLCTGSSFATPVAASIGALVLAFASQIVCYANYVEASEHIDPKTLRTTGGMIKVLKVISTQPEFAGHWSLNTQMFWASYKPYRDAEKDEEKAREHAWGLIKDALRS